MQIVTSKELAHDPLFLLSLLYNYGYCIVARCQGGGIFNLRCTLNTVARVLDDHSSPE